MTADGFAAGGAARCAVAAAAAGSDALAVSLLDTLDGIEALAADWRSLEARSEHPAFFQSAAWSIEAARHFAAAGTTFLVVALRRAGRLVAVAPLKRLRCGPLVLAVDLGAPFGQYGGLLVDPGEDADAVVDAVLAALRGQGVDGLLLRKLRADAPERPALARRGFPVGRPEAARAVALHPERGFEAFRRGLPARIRKNVRNARNRAAALGSVDQRVFAAEALPAMLDASFAGRSARLAAEGLTSTAFADPGFRAFVGRVAEAGAAGRIAILASGLHAGEMALALEWGFVHRGRYYAYLTARDPRFDGFSPGRIHREEVLKTLIERGVAVADLLAPDGPHKRAWTADATPIRDIAVPLTLRGRLYLAFWHGLLRPALVETYFALPARFRRPLHRLIAPRHSD